MVKKNYHGSRLIDEGDHEEPVRLVITLKSNRVNANDLMNHYLHPPTYKNLIE
ncbi:MAG: hypothetical protein Ct9H90mP22_0620 [Gammaproteobacteria bacterium]|nr:MAG: hypothetical protein Ct9H90mP22_0620 [Gammaproteobacteria bacterium]